MVTSSSLPPAFPRKVIILPILVGVFIVLANLQWMRMYQLINAPFGDSLVYLTEAANDYWTLRGEGWGPLLAKYVLAGNQQTSPLLWWSADFLFFLLGLDPANAYLAIGLAYLAWISGVIFLAWQIKPDRAFALASGFMAALLPSAASNGLRNFMLDFVAAAPFIWATAFLLKSNLFRKRREALLYGFFCGLTVLFRTTALPYFLAHCGILVILIVRGKKTPHSGNILLALFIGAITCGWFIVPNYHRILSYYGYWAKEAPKIQGGTSFINNFKFYLSLLSEFHFSPFILKIYLIMVLAAAVILAVSIKVAKKGQKYVPQLWASILPLFALAGIPTIILALFPSRASTVDYPFIAAYLIFPLLLWREIFPSSRLFWIPAIVLLFILGQQTGSHLFRSPTPDGRPQDFREREAIQLILDHSQKLGLQRIKLGNTCIHQHNSLAYQYWFLMNTFPNWRGRIDLATIGRTESAEELARMNADCDYVITLKNYHGDWHPNNRVAPDANRILRNDFDMEILPQRLDLPDGTTLEILTKGISVQYGPGAADGWHENQVPIRIVNPKRVPIRLKIEGNLLQWDTKQETALITLKSMADPLKVIQGNSTAKLDMELEIPASFFSPEGQAEFVLSSSWAYKPEEFPQREEKRRLAFRYLKILGMLRK